MRIGVMGGTFDPVHIAHLVLAQQALEQLGLDKVLFIPAGDPWRKSDRDPTLAVHRLAMTRLAVEDNESFEVDDMEVRRQGPTYTIETLTHLRNRYDADDELFLLLGEDALADLPNWHEPEGIAEAATIVVAARPDVASPQVPATRGRIVHIEMPLLEVSSTELRERARQGRSVRYLVPDAVIDYIEAHGLYLR